MKQAPEMSAESRVQASAPDPFPNSRRPAVLTRLFRFFRTGEDRPPLTDRGEIDRIYRRNRMAIMIAITVGYGVSYTCRLGLSVVKKPLIDGGIFTRRRSWTDRVRDFLRVRIRQARQRFSRRSRQCQQIPQRGRAVVGADQHRDGLVPAAVGLGGPVGAERLVSGFRRARRDRRPLTVVRQPRTRADITASGATAHSLGKGLTFVGSAALVAWFGWRAAFAGPGILCVLSHFSCSSSCRTAPDTLGLPAVAEWRKGRTATIPPQNPRAPGRCNSPSSSFHRSGSSPWPARRCT